MKDETSFALGMLIGAIITLIVCVYILVYKTPQAIDVYRGKTTLEITYRDSIPIDTIVVWKNK